MVPLQHFAVIVLANKGGALLNKTAEKAMELLLPLEAKAEAKPKQALTVSEAEIGDVIGKYANKPESAEILVKEGKLVIKREDGVFPITKIGDRHFSIIKPGESEPEGICACAGWQWKGRIPAHRTACADQKTAQRVILGLGRADRGQAAHRRALPGGSGRS